MIFRVFASVFFPSSQAPHGFNSNWGTGVILPQKRLTDDPISMESILGDRKH